MSKASFKTTKEWDTVNWAKAEWKVFKLQNKIFQAVKSGQKAQAQNLQKLLFKSHYAKLLAVHKVTQKTDNDRAKQMLVKLVLEPYWEAQFEGRSYGLRPGRTPHDAIEQIFTQIRYKAKFVLIGNIAECGGQIKQNYLLSKLDCPSPIKSLIKQWLKKGIMDNGVRATTNEIISPLLVNIALEGMILDVINQFPNSITRNGVRIRNYRPVIIRHAYDFVVFHPEVEIVKQCQQLIFQWLENIGLRLNLFHTEISHTLSPIKTSTNGKEKPGFDFLGFNIRSYPVGKYHSGKIGYGKLIGFKTIIKPSKKSIQAHYENLREVINKNRMAPQAKLIKELNSQIRVWCDYFKTVCSTKVFSHLDYLLWNKLRAWRVTRTGSANYRKLSNYFSEGKYGQWTFQTNNGLFLIKHQETEIQRHTFVRPDASPYDGNWNYWNQRKSLLTEKTVSMKRS